MLGSQISGTKLGMGQIVSYVTQFYVFYSFKNAENVNQHRDTCEFTGFFILISHRFKLLNLTIKIVFVRVGIMA